MSSPLANLIRRRFAWITFFLVLAFGTMVPYFAIMLVFIPPTLPGVGLESRLLFWSYALFFLLHFAAVIFAFTLAMGWNLQFKLSFRFRPGMLIKYIFWGSGLFTIYSGIIAYLVLVEGKDFQFWYLAATFLADLLSLITAMIVHYAIGEDVKKRKVCEFC